MEFEEKVLGRVQRLYVTKQTKNGVYLGSYEFPELHVLLPNNQVPEEIEKGDILTVFLYKDSEDRLIATTTVPRVRLGEFARLSVTDVTNIGAFLDWGLAKDLLVPFREQRVRMRRGGIYLVYIYVDNATGRIVASAKIDKFLGNVLPEYKEGQKVRALVTEHTEIGYKCIVDNLHRGMLYSNELFSPVEVEDTISAFVKRVRTDGKIDLTVSDRAGRRTDAVADRLLAYLASGDGIPVGDRSDPELISRLFGCSKRDFKQAVGHLYRKKKIVVASDGIVSLAPKHIGRGQ